MRTITITLDHLPPKELNPNNLRRTHWTVRSRFSRIAKDEMAWLAKHHWKGKKPMNKAIIRYEFHFKDNRTHDYDNLLSACKPYQDGLVVGGVIVNDDCKHLEIGSLKAFYDGVDKVVIKVEERK